jgi:hypothetical protein
VATDWILILVGLIGAGGTIVAGVLMSRTKQIKLNVNHRLDKALDEIAALRAVITTSQVSGKAAVSGSDALDS